MPGDKTVTHPLTGWQITFNEEAHSYIDDQGNAYASGTGLVSAFFPEFDIEFHAERIAARDNRLTMDVIADWNRKRDESCRYGTKVHEHAENLILGRSPAKPDTEKERIAFSAVDKALAGLNQHYDIIGCEQIIFAPCLHLAGTIDLPVRSKTTGRLGVFDWKTNETLDITARFGDYAKQPISHIPDCNGNHYRMQFAVYAHIMRIGQYVALDEPFDNAIIYIPPMSQDPAFVPMQDAPSEAEAMTKTWENAYFNQTLPAPEFLKTARKAA